METDFKSKNIFLRAYAPSEKKMYYFNVEQILSYHEEAQEDACSMEARHNGFMQDIGIKLNGNKLYEGDIIICTNLQPYNTEFFKSRKSELLDTPKNVVLTSITTIPYQIKDCPQDFEIVGNVYENDSIEIDKAY